MAEPETDLTNAIAESAAGPARVVIDGQVSEEHPLGEQAKADAYLAGKRAARKGNLGLVFRKIIPPGAT